ncbi:bifunctional 2-polyprenyl-6-hydroxyphenol methylase/3-demethylubiquinol 3-O-methyltransferase UbiG [Synechococcus sp. PCC 6312]|uniref:class I SAM-dependent methyltransferase n=1 Tax=Synechococcus sp. (strain ATCC 27167 / PCC 6312) TaxID=195253 RepID=UPI00029F14D0|nr:class I SAM-dependent methyltransferase [Synechococcus sp. PCC 6312]AFY62264.1 methyltransferase family protein [Synechococcus sp. PCC 6312]
MIYSPLTGSDQVRRLQTFQVEELIQAWQDTFQIDISLEFKSYQNIYLYECLETKLQFFYPFDIEGSGKLYAQLMGFTWYYMSDKWEYQLAFQDIQRQQRILEVGSGFGRFIQAAQDQRFNIQGIELNPDAIQSAQAQGLPISSATLAELLEQGEMFDCICSFQVLEHIANAKKFLTECLSLLHPDGTLLLGLPNRESFLQYQYNLLDMPPHHMSRWSLTSCQALEHLFPLRLERVEFEPLAAYHVEGYLESYTNYYQASNHIGKWWLNSWTQSIAAKILKVGLRHRLKGQSFYVKYRKLATPQADDPSSIEMRN